MSNNDDAEFISPAEDDDVDKKPSKPAGPPTRHFSVKTSLFHALMAMRENKLPDDAAGFSKFRKNMKRNFHDALELSKTTAAKIEEMTLDLHNMEVLAKLLLKGFLLQNIDTPFPISEGLLKVVLYCVSKDGRSFGTPSHEDPAVYARLFEFAREFVDLVKSETDDGDPLPSRSQKSNNMNKLSERLFINFSVATKANYSNVVYQFVGKVYKPFKIQAIKSRGLSAKGTSDAMANLGNPMKAVNNALTSYQFDLSALKDPEDIEFVRRYAPVVQPPGIVPVKNSYKYDVKTKEHVGYYWVAIVKMQQIMQPIVNQLIQQELEAARSDVLENVAISKQQATLEIRERAIH